MSSETSQISEREREILRLVAVGATNQQIADQLHISVNTVKVHLRNIFEKIGVTSRTEATVYAIRLGLIQLHGQATVAADLPADFAPAALPVQLEAPAEPLTRDNAIASLPDLSEVDLTATNSPAAGDALASTAPAAPAAAPRRMLVPLVIVGLAVLLVAVLAYILLPLQAPPTVITQPSAPVASPAKFTRWKQHAAWPNSRADFAVASYDGKIYTIGGTDAAGPSGSVDRYDPAQDQWVSLNAKPTPVTHVQAARIGGRIYVPGGEDKDGVALSVFEAYDPRSQQWETLPDLPAPRSRYALADFEGQLYLFGGWDGSQARKEVFAYDPASKKWTEREPLPTARSNAGAALVEDHIYVIGGENGQGPLRANERFDPTSAGSGAWESVVPLAVAIATPAVISTLDSVLVFDPQLRNATQYDPAKDSWTPPLAIPPDTIISARALSLGTSVFLFGPPDGNRAGAINEYQAAYTTLFPVIGNGQ